MVEVLDFVAYERQQGALSESVRRSSSVVVRGREVLCAGQVALHESKPPGPRPK